MGKKSSVLVKSKKQGNPFIFSQNHSEKVLFHCPSTVHICSAVPRLSEFLAFSSSLDKIHLTKIMVRVNLAISDQSLRLVYDYFIASR